MTPLRVVICGDIRHSRVARSNVRLLPRLGAEVRLAGPPELMPDGKLNGWPNGASEHFPGCVADTLVLLMEGTGKTVPQALPR